MQFVKGGPDIPERLLQAHEDGGVIFFCGAAVPVSLAQQVCRASTVW